MKILPKKKREREPDDSLFGLLAAYKVNSTYVRIIVSEEQKKAVFQMTDNPRYFPEIPDAYRQLKRSEMNINKLFVKYLLPEHVLEYAGENMGMKLTVRTGKIGNYLADKEKRYFQLEMPLRYLSSIVPAVKKLVTLTPQKKYEIVEKYLANTSKPEMQE